MDRIAEIGKTIPLHSSSRELINPVRGYCTRVVGTHLILLSICRTCIQVQFDVSALQSAPHLDDLFLHRERKELESGAPAALGEGAFAGTRLVRRFRPMDEHERGGRWLYRWRRKPSASGNRQSKISQESVSQGPPVHWGVEYNNLRFTGEGQDELERGLTETYATHDSRDTIYDKRHDSHGCHTGETPQHATRAARGARGTQHTHDTRAAIPARRPGVPPREACERRVRRACPLPGVPGFT